MCYFTIDEMELAARSRFQADGVSETEEVLSELGAFYPVVSYPATDEPDESDAAEERTAILAELVAR